MDSGIEVRKWILLLILALVKKYIKNGPMFQDEEGNPVPISALDVIFHEVLEEVSNRKKKFLGKDVGTEKE